jgi:thiamine transport system ATP-binding protein
VFQDDQLFPHLDVAGNVGFGPAHAAGAGDGRDAAGSTNCWRSSGSPASRTRSVTNAERRRGEARGARSIARAAPGVLLLDEPLTGLDRDLHDRSRATSPPLLRSTGTTALLVTHDRDEAAMDRRPHRHARSTGSPARAAARASWQAATPSTEQPPPRSASSARA